MTAGSSSRNRNWSSRRSSRSSANRRRASRTTRATSGTTWRSGTPRRRGSCSEPRPRPTHGRVWPTSGETRGADTGAIRARGTVPGQLTPPPMLPPPRGRGRRRTPGPLPTGTRRRRRGWPTTGTPSWSCSLHLFYCCFSIPNQSVGTSSCAGPWWFSIFEFLKNSIYRLWLYKIKNIVRTIINIFTIIQYLRWCFITSHKRTKILTEHLLWENVGNLKKANFTKSGWHFKHFVSVFLQ